MPAAEIVQARLKADQDPFLRLQQVAYLCDEWMPFHGISHPDQVRANAAEIIGHCKTFGVHVDELALDRAISLHDALLHIDPRLLNFRSPEEMAARLAHNFAVSIGCTQSEALKVERIIMATHAMIRPQGVEETIMRAADIRNLAQSFEKFTSNTLRLHREEELVRGVEVALDQWVGRSFHFLRHYLWPMLEITPMARDDAARSVWHVNSIGNLTRFWRDNSAPDGRVVVEVLGANDPILPEGDRPFFYIALENFESRREKLVHWFPGMLSNKSVAVTVPGNNNVMSLPDSCCDQLTLSELSREAAGEAWRVLRPDGRLVFRLSPERGSMAPESGPIPPGFLFEKIVEGKSGKEVILQKIERPL